MRVGDTLFLDVDRWAFECVRDELRIHAEMCKSGECPALANRLLASLDKAVVFRRCGCGERSCHSYTFVEQMTPAIRTLTFERYAGWDAFNIIHDGNRVLDVEILAAAGERYLR